MRFNKLIVILMIIPVMIVAKPLSKSEITNLGVQAYRQKAQLIHPQSVNAELKSLDLLKNDGIVDMAVLHFGDGFLILSADDAVRPVLAYSFDGDMDLDNTAPAIWVFLEQYRYEIATVRRLQLPATPDIQEEWEQLLYPMQGTRTTTIVAPLVKSTWNQDKYYNYLCPEDDNAPNGYDNHVPNGCVSIAMSQIIYYYRYPETGSGSHTNHSSYGDFYVDFSQQHYNYDAMRDKLDYYNNEVAKLIFHCGTAVNMMYGADGSGAYSDDVPGAMATYFKYDPNAKRISKYHYSDSSWHQQLITCLDASHPVYYAGYSEEGGHAFICDGYNSDEYFHFNFGWGGSGNGFYATQSNDSVQDAVGGYDHGQSAIINLYPLEDNYPTYCQERVIDAINGTLEDGSGPLNYLNKSSCTYVIANPNQTSVNITIQSLDTQEEHDLLKFWNRNPCHDSLLMTLSGRITQSVTYSFNTDSLYITFETDESVTGKGWRLLFDAQRDVDGCISSLSTEFSGTFGDNSGDNNYEDNADCRLVLRINSAQSITFTFEEFNISPEDHLDFYNLATSPNTLLGRFSGNDLPAPVTYPTKQILVKFISDNYLNGKGFQISWNAAGSGIESQDMGTTLYPNPASNIIHITFKEPVGSCETILYDMVGNIVYIQDFQNSDNIEIPVNQLSNGIYLLSLKHDGQTFHRKILVNH